MYKGLLRCKGANAKGNILTAASSLDSTRLDIHKTTYRLSKQYKETCEKGGHLTYRIE